jgi:hypothetical protein
MIIIDCAPRIDNVWGERSPTDRAPLTNTNHVEHQAGFIPFAIQLEHCSLTWRTIVFRFNLFSVIFPSYRQNSNARKCSHIRKIKQNVLVRISVSKVSRCEIAYMISALAWVHVTLRTGRKHSVHCDSGTKSTQRIRLF